LPRLTFVTLDGERHHVEAEAGLSVMEAATRNGIEGIPADCGGACACATCHVYVDPTWLDKLPPKSDIEADMLECTQNPQPNSRLSCQIIITNQLNGITLVVPEE
jgi:2Fe-2S ferredoxin